MKILHIITKAGIGGAQMHILQLSTHFKGRGHEVAVMAYPGGQLETDLKESGIGFYENEFLQNSFNPFLGLKAMKRIRAVVGDFQPDIVSCHSSMAGVWGRFAIRNSVPTVFTAHGWAFTQGVALKRKVVAIVAEKVAAWFCGKIICVSWNDYNLALKYKITNRNKLTTVHNGAELCEEVEKGEDDGPVKIVYVSRLEEPKKPEVLLQAYNGLGSDLQKKARVVMVGGGPKKEMLERYVGENDLGELVDMRGTLSREEIFEVLREGDVFVLVSRYEGFPIAILEAMSCGLPVVASDVGGVSEVVDEKTGIILKKNTKEELGEALKELITNPEKRHAMRAEARKKIKDEFSLEKMYRETGEVYKELLKPSE